MGPLRALVDRRGEMTLLNLALAIPTSLVALAISMFFLLLAAPFALVPRGRRERLIWWTNAGCAWAILRFALLVRSIDVQGREHLPVYGTPYLVVCNHRGFCDVPTLIWAARAQGISKKLVFYFPAMGLLGYLGGAVFFDRREQSERLRAKEEAVFLLQRGVPLHVYPEGTRTRDGKLREKVSLGLLVAASEAGVCLVPAGIVGTDDVIPPTNKGIRYFQDIRLRFGEPLSAADFDSPLAQAEAAWGAVKAIVEDLEEGPP